MIQNNKGCVYFFRHIGLTPVKIGYSEYDNPLERFNQFKTYAPYGAEILGFIIINDARTVESLLHSKYQDKRLRGEWFEITAEQVIKEIDFYSNIQDIEDRNNFQLAWANELKRRKETIQRKITENQYAGIIGSVEKGSTFTCSAFVNLACKFGIPNRTAMRLLKEQSSSKTGVFVKIKHGVYTKP